ncbi:MAG TPA: citrate lyase subunit alpha, partial [Vibrio sp.]|nr:citrate lyase subunit alpha [Vibrio sp.]
MKNINLELFERYQIQPYSGPHALTSQLKQGVDRKHRKISPSIEQAIKDSGLQDGMTISFHHSFRGGDKTINLVMQALAEMGFKDLTLASSSLSDIHSPLVEHIKNGVVKKIYTSGLRGDLAEEISRGLMEEPIHIHSHGGRVHLVETGELNIDVAFLGVSTSDEFGNANAVSGKAKCGSLGYAQIDAQYAQYTVLLTEELVTFPNQPASIAQDQVDAIVQVESVGDASKIGGGATRMT